MNFQQLKYVLAVHKHKHFGMAAESCHVTQATLSAMIKKLEQSLDFEIFDRTKHPIRTTDQGELLTKLAKKILYYESEIKALSQNKISIEGDLNIGIIPTVASTLLPIILPAITANLPKLKLKISEVTTEEILQQLTMDKIDLGILATPLQNDDFSEQILYYEPMMIYGIGDHGKSYVTSSDVQDKPVAKYLNYVYGEKEGGGTQYLMLSAVPFEKLGMPSLPNHSDASISEGIQHTVYKGLIAPFALLAGLMFATYRSSKKENAE